MNPYITRTLLVSLLSVLLLLPATSPAQQAGEILYWVAPMDPNYRRDKPGKSPMGMDLIPVYADAAGGDGDQKYRNYNICNRGNKVSCEFLFENMNDLPHNQFSLVSWRKMVSRFWVSW